MSSCHLTFCHLSPIHKLITGASMHSALCPSVTFTPFTHRSHSYWSSVWVKCLSQGLIDMCGERKCCMCSFVHRFGQVQSDQKWSCVNWCSLLGAVHLWSDYQSKGQRWTGLKALFNKWRPTVLFSTKFWKWRMLYPEDCLQIGTNLSKTRYVFYVDFRLFDSM